MPSPPKTESGHDRKERIMLVGDSDAGKTHQVLKVAEWHQRRKADTHFYAICSPGNEWDVMLAPSADFGGLTNVTWDVVYEMQDWYDLYDRYRKKAKAGDWFIADVQTDMWTDAQEEYDMAHGGGSGNPWTTEDDDDKDWAGISSRHNNLGKRFLRWPGHQVGLYHERAPFKDPKNRHKDAKALFDPFGIFPEGNKKDYKRFHTILHLARNSQEKHTWRTVRDRQREHLGTRNERKGLVTIKPEICEGKDLFKDYLMPVGGWKL